MSTRTVTAMFGSRAEAERASQALVSELHIDRAMIRTNSGAEGGDAGYDASRPYEDTGFFGSLKDLFVPDEDRYAYAEGMRRGSVLVSAKVDDAYVDRATQILESAGAMDLDATEASWRRSGWTGYDAAAHDSYRSTTTGATSAAAVGATSARVGQGNTADDTIKVVEERLKIGKRAVSGGSLRVRSYVVETPVEEQVRLRDETVHVDRHAVDRPATAADLEAFQDRTIEAREVDEEAVVSKTVHVVEEIGVHKDATERVETVRDTVRRTQVDVEDTTGTKGGTTQGLGTSTSGSTGSMGGTSSNPPGTQASRAIDSTLGTNVSGANPGGSDGTPGNPPGTMASRAVDKTIGTNISGANPERKT